MYSSQLTPQPAVCARKSELSSTRRSLLQGPNLLKLARKEQCLALLTQLRTKFKLNGQFYRVFPNGEVGTPSARLCPSSNAVRLRTSATQ